jgi:hypothetical protein
MSSSPESQASKQKPLMDTQQHWVLIGLSYIVIALVYTKGAIFKGNLHGYLTVDMADTLYLRQEFINQITGQPLVGSYPTLPQAMGLLPNFLDHLSASAFYWLPFPFSDNLWWLFVFVGSGTTAHYVGKQLGKGYSVAWLCGLSWMLSEPMLREFNLFHAPQALTLLMPLYLLALIKWLEKPSNHTAIACGGLLGVNAMIYWYYGFFLILISGPLILFRRHRSSLTIGLISAVIALPGLYYFVSGQSILLEPSALIPGVDQLSHWFVPDRSNRISIVLLIGAVFSVRKTPYGLYWLGVIVFAYTLSSGGIVWETIQSLHPIFERLHWPVRWSVLIPLVSLPLLCRLPHARYWLTAFIIETMLLSPNIPLEQTEVSPYKCYAQLRSIKGAVLPVGYTNNRQRPWIALHQRFHQRPVVAELAVPPQAPHTQEWALWIKANPWDERFSGALPFPEDTREQLKALGVGVIALDQGEASGLSLSEQNRYLLQLATQLGPPKDIGCSWIWWIEKEYPTVKIEKNPQLTKQKSKIERLDAQHSKF